MATKKTKRVVHNPVTGSDYAVYERVTDPDEPLIKGLWHKEPTKKPKPKKKEEKGMDMLLRVFS